MTIPTDEEGRLDPDQEGARLTLCVLRLTAEGCHTNTIRARLGIGHRRIAQARRLGVVKAGGLLSLTGGDELRVVESCEGACARVRVATRDIDWRSTNDWLDAEGLDYVALLGSLLNSAARPSRAG